MSPNLHSLNILNSLPLDIIFRPQLIAFRYTEKQMTDIVVAHRDTNDWADKLALGVLRVFRFGMDTATGYTHTKEVVKGTTESKKGWFVMNERKWLTRFLFLESVAGVPGMVAASIRHLHSLRRLKRDNGW